MPDKQSTTVAEPAEQTEADRKSKKKRQPPYNVVLWNDEDHTYAYVVNMMMRLFGYPFERGYQIAKTVDTEGKAIVMTTTLEHAELKRDQIHAFGPDSEVDGCAGSMYATVEPAAS